MRNHITTKLQDDKSGIGIAIEIAELHAIDTGEDITRATPHRYIIHHHARRCLQRDSIDMSLAMEMEFALGSAVGKGNERGKIAALKIGTLCL